METKQTISDNSPYEKCGSRTALITGTFEYIPHSEPYQEGRKRLMHVGERNIIYRYDF